MAQSTSHSSSLNRAEETWLLPSNRKLRNLVSISLRNISLAQTSPSRNRNKAIDDDALPQTLKSPAKLVALREQKALGHSRSSTDLRAVLEDAANESATTDEAVTNGSPAPSKHKQRPQSAASDSPKRPNFTRLRRRSTIEWANATPQKRQERLESVTKERMADVFFSIHVKGVEGWCVPETIGTASRRADIRDRARICLRNYREDYEPNISSYRLADLRSWCDSATRLLASRLGQGSQDRRLAATSSLEAGAQWTAVSRQKCECSRSTFRSELTSAAR